MIGERYWINQIKQHNDQKYANKLIKKYYKEIYIFVYKQVIDEQLALDLTQELFIRMLQSLPSFDERKSGFRTWLYRISTNHCIDYLRSKENKVKKLTTFDVDEEKPDPSDGMVHLEYKEQYEYVNELLLRFDEVVQQIVRYKIFSQLTFNEISQMIQLPESTVKTNYYKAIRRLKKEMEGYDESRV